MKFVYSQYTHAHTYDQIVENKKKHTELDWLLIFVRKFVRQIGKLISNNKNRNEVVCDLWTRIRNRKLIVFSGVQVWGKIYKEWNQHRPINGRLSLCKPPNIDTCLKRFLLSFSPTSEFIKLRNDENWLKT